MPPYYYQNDEIYFNPLKNSNALALNELVDPYLSNVVLYLKGDGENNSTDIIDSSPNPKTITRVGDVKISTAQSKYGNSSLLFQDNGYLIIEQNSSLEFGINPFTIECWYYHNISNKKVSLASNVNDATSINYWFFYVENNILKFQTRRMFDGSQTQYIAVSNSSLVSGFNHLAVTRVNGVAKIWQNGQLVGTVNDTNLYLPQRNFFVGGFFIPNFNSFLNNSYLDSFRVTLAERYTAPFNPETDTFLS